MELWKATFANSTTAVEIISFWNYKQAPLSLWPSALAFEIFGQVGTDPSHFAFCSILCYVLQNDIQLRGSCRNILFIQLVMKKKTEKKRANLNNARVDEV